MSGDDGDGFECGYCSFLERTVALLLFYIRFSKDEKCASMITLDILNFLSSETAQQ